MRTALAALVWLSLGFVGPSSGQSTCSAEDLETCMQRESEACDPSDGPAFALCEQQATVRCSRIPCLAAGCFACEGGLCAYQCEAIDRCETCEFGTSESDPGLCRSICPPCEECDGRGGCVSLCGAGELCCSGSCRNLDSDPQNCGACGNQCRPDQVCVAGSCACPPGRTECSGTCADLSADDLHCGECDRRCGINRACTEGVCKCNGTSGASGARCYYRVEMEGFHRYTWGQSGSATCADGRVVTFDADRTATTEIEATFRVERWPDRPVWESYRVAESDPSSYEARFEDRWTMTGGCCGTQTITADASGKGPVVNVAPSPPPAAAEMRFVRDLYDSERRVYGFFPVQETRSERTCNQSSDGSFAYRLTLPCTPGMYYDPARDTYSGGCSGVSHGIDDYREYETRILMVPD